MHYPTGGRKLSIVKDDGPAKMTEEEIRPLLIHSDDPGVPARDPADPPEDPTDLPEQEDHQDPSRGR